MIDMYGGLKEEIIEDAPHYYNVQAYRDTIAPLMARRMSLTHSTWVPPVVPYKLRTSVSSPIMRVAELSPDILTADSKNAPSFTEFSRNLKEKRNDMVSSFSTESHHKHRQEALERLAPPSPQDSLEALSVAYEQTRLSLPGPMSGTITDIVATEYIPEMLDPKRKNRALLSPQEAVRITQGAQLENPPPVFQQPDTNQSWSRVMDKLNKRRSQEEREKKRVLSYASAKYPGMRAAALRKASDRSSGSSITKRATNIMSVISGAGSKSDKNGSNPSSATMPRRQKQLAVKTTPYQEFGPDVWLPLGKQEKKKKREDRKITRERQEEQKRHRRDRSSGNSKAFRGSDLNSACHSGQNQIFGVMQRLSRSASEKRREKLKKNIVLVGPTDMTNEKHSFESAGGWR